MNDSERPQSDFRWRIWWPAFGGFAMFIATAIVGWALSPTDIMPVDDWRVLMCLCGGVPIAILGLVWSVLRFRREMRRDITQLIADVFLEGGRLLFVGPCGYFPGYRGGPFVWTVGGTLGLTDSELIFRSGPGNFQNHDLRIPLTDVRSAEQCAVSFSNCGLKVSLRDGSTFYFAFNVLNGTSAVERIAQCILVARGGSDT